MSAIRAMDGAKPSAARPPPCWLEVQLPVPVLFDFLPDTSAASRSCERAWMEGRRTHGSPRLARALPTLRSTGLHHAFPRSPHSLRALSHLSALSLPMLLARRALIFILRVMWTGWVVLNKHRCWLVVFVEDERKDITRG